MGLRHAVLFSVVISCLGLGYSFSRRISHITERERRRKPQSKFSTAFGDLIEFRFANRINDWRCTCVKKEQKKLLLTNGSFDSKDVYRENKQKTLLFYHT